MIECRVEIGDFVFVGQGEVEKRKERRAQVEYGQCDGECGHGSEGANEGVSSSGGDKKVKVGRKKGGKTPALKRRAVEALWDAGWKPREIQEALGLKQRTTYTLIEGIKERRWRQAVKEEMEREERRRREEEERKRKEIEERERLEAECRKGGIRVREEWEAEGRVSQVRKFVQ